MILISYIFIASINTVDCVRILFQLTLTFVLALTLHCTLSIRTLALREFTFAIEAVSAPKVRGGDVFSSGGYGSTLRVWSMLMFGAKNSVADWQHE